MRCVPAFVLCGLALAPGGAAAGTAGADPAAGRLRRPSFSAAIDSLGKLDYDTRTKASRTIRRSPAAQAVPALMQAVSDHADGYVRYRALVLLTGFNDPRARDVIRDVLTSPNDRLRTVAYSFLEHNPDRTLVPNLLAALDKETGEFVRPSLVRALAAQASGPGNDGARVRQCCARGGPRPGLLPHRGHRGAGRFQGASTRYDALTAIAKLDGPLQNDTAIALGKIGDQACAERARDAPANRAEPSQPYVAAAICLLGVNCDTHEKFLVDTLKFADTKPGFQQISARPRRASPRSRSPAGRGGRGAVCRRDSVARSDPRPGVAGARHGRAAPHAADVDDPRDAPESRAAIELMAEGFDMLEEDYEKERFFALVRRTYWDSPEDSPARELMRTLIGKLDF